MNRRALLSLTALAVPAAALGGCSIFAAIPPALATVVADAKLIANGLAAIPGVGTLAATIAQQVENYAGQVDAAIVTLGGVYSTAAARPSVGSIEAAVNATVALLAGIPLPPPFSTYLQAVAALLPTIEAAVGLAVPSGTPASLRAGGMAPDQARLVLASAH